MSAEDSDLVEWFRKQGDEARRQIELFGSGVKALLQTPDGSTQDITIGVVAHQTENMAVFERLIAALKP